MISIPFSGSKKFSYKNVKPIVEAGEYNTVFEVFGGSAVLSANLYNDGIVERAVINDFDGLFDIYPEYLDYKDWIVENCLKYGIKRRISSRHPITGKGSYYYVDDNGTKIWNKRALNEPETDYLQSLVKQIPKKYWRLLAIGGNFTFSAIHTHKEIKLSDFKYFSDYIWTDKQRKYLGVINSIETDCLDYKDFLKKHSSEFDNNTILIIDPPYCGTAQGQYKKTFSESDTLDLLNTLNELRTDFIFFNYDPKKVKGWFRDTGIDYKSMEWTGNITTSANRKRKDVMVYVKFDRGNDND